MSAALAWQALQVAGALMILGAFAAAQSGRLRTSSRAYLWLNLVGSAILAVLALRLHQWGFVLLETAWAAVSAGGLWRVAREGSERSAGP